MSTPSSSSLPRRSARISKKTPQSPKKPSQPRATKRKPPRLPAPDPDTPQTLYLRVNRGFLLLPPAPDQPNPVPMPILSNKPNLDVIVANLPDLHPFAGNTVDWLIRVARLIFEPLGMSSLYTFTTGPLESWMNREFEPLLWRRVEQGEQLEATIYEFRPDNDVPITPTKMSLRDTRSVTSATPTSTNRATTFRSELLRRDRACIVTQTSRMETLIASHLIPRRLGDAGVQSAIERFTGAITPVDRYNSTVGVLLYMTLDVFVDSFRAGFWKNGDGAVSDITFHAYHVNILRTGMAGPICCPQF